MKTALVVIGVGIIALAAFYFWAPAAPSETANTSHEQVAGEKAVVTEGTYAVRSEDSTVSWAGKKPLIEGYVNSGSLSVKSGSISVAGGAATGTFLIDMNTLSVSSTPTKPGKESALEGHLKGEGWFNVAAYPEASFAITKVSPQAQSDTTFVYDVTGTLTMKGKSGELTFPANIYADEQGLLHASADLEFDRTKWDLTASSGSFFDNLANNVVDDMVSLSFHIVAEKQ